MNATSNYIQQQTEYICSYHDRSFLSKLFSPSPVKVIAAVISHIVKDGTISEDERAKIEQIKNSSVVRMKGINVEEMVNDAVYAKISKMAATAFADGFVNEDEEQGILSAASCLGADLNGSKYASIMKSVREFSAKYQRAYGELRPVSTELILGRNEQCFVYTAASLSELRKVRTSTTYSGPVISIPIMKGVRYRVGNVKPTAHTKDVSVTLNSGMLSITNKRLVLTGNTKSNQIRFSSIAKVELYSDGFTVFKASGKPQTFHTGESISGIILSRLLYNG